MGNYLYLQGKMIEMNEILFLLFLKVQIFQGITLINYRKILF